MPAAAVTRIPMQQEHIDWERTGLLLGVLIALGTVLKTLLRPIGERIAYVLLKERFDRYDKAMETLETIADEHRAFKEMILAHGKALTEVPRMTSTMESLSETMGRLDDTLKGMDDRMRDFGEWRARTEGMWEGEERRGGRGGRRHDDPPRER